MSSGLRSLALGFVLLATGAWGIVPSANKSGSNATQSPQRSVDERPTPARTPAPKGTPPAPAAAGTPPAAAAKTATPSAIAAPAAPVAPLVPVPAAPALPAAPAVPSATPAPKAAAPEIEAPPAPPPQRPQLPREPSIYETGRIGKAKVEDPGARIEHTEKRTIPHEQQVERATETEERRPATALPGVPNQAILEREVRARFTPLKDCKVEAARRKKVAPAAITASHLTLRWTILPSGRVADTQVVPTAPADSHVVDCVKRQMIQWSFTPAAGGAARVEQPYKFPQ